MSPPSDLSRREFLVLAGAGSAAVAANGFARGDETTAAEAATLPTRTLGRAHV